MKIKTSELTGAALDWAVAKCEGKDAVISRHHRMTGPEVHDRALIEMEVDGPTALSYSTDWEQGGPIIERNRINMMPMTPIPTPGDDREPYWLASDERVYDFKEGPTPLIAAMRCYVASKLGDEVEIPEELAQ